MNVEAIRAMAKAIETRLLTVGCGRVYDEWFSDHMHGDMAWLLEAVDELVEKSDEAGLNERIVELETELADARKKIDALEEAMAVMGEATRPAPRARQKAMDDRTLRLDFGAFGAPPTVPTQQKPTPVRTDRAARIAQIAREASLEARGFRYAVECSVGWVGADDKCTHREPQLFEGDRESSQARAVQHRTRNELGGACHHAPFIVPESEIAKRLAVHAGGSARPTQTPASKESSPTAVTSLAKGSVALRVLTSIGVDFTSASDIKRATQLSSADLKVALIELRQAGRITVEGRGRWTRYRRYAAEETVGA